MTLYGDARCRSASRSSSPARRPTVPGPGAPPGPASHAACSTDRSSRLVRRSAISCGWRRSTTSTASTCCRSWRRRRSRRAPTCSSSCPPTSVSSRSSSTVHPAGEATALAGRAGTVGSAASVLSARSETVIVATGESVNQPMVRGVGVAQRPPITQGAASAAPIRVTEASGGMARGEPARIAAAADHTSRRHRRSRSAPSRSACDRGSSTATRCSRRRPRSSA